MGNLETIVLSRSRVNHPAFCGKGHAHASCNMQQRRDCNAANKKKSWKCIEVASKQACVRASLKTAFTARNAMVFVCQKGLPNHFKSLMYTNTQRRNPYNEHDSSRKTGFRLRRCSLCPSCPFWNFCRAARSQRLSYRRHLTKTRSNPESRLFRVRYESDICPAIDAHPRFRKNQLQP